MDYGKSGAPKMKNNAPRHTEHNAYGSDDKPFGQRPTKAELLAKMKKSGEGKPEGETPQNLDRPSDPADDVDIDEAKGKSIRGHEHIDGGEAASDPDA